MMLRTVVTLLAVVCFALTENAIAQIHDPRALEADPATATEAIAPVLDGLGDEHITITTNDPKAQEFFDQGLRLTYGFNHSEALRAFKETARLDPDCAMAYWGWALVLGPNLNLPMQDEVKAQAYEALQAAVSLKDNASEHEQAYIDALAVRYSDPEDDEPADRKELDLLYADAMKLLHDAYPDDNNAATLYAASLMNLNPWSYWQGDGSPRENTAELLAVLEAAIENDGEHTGAIHYYVHAVEAAHPQRAEVPADTLAALAPNAGHLVHMPAHIYMRLGRYGDSYDTNVKAVEADEGYITSCSAQGIYPLGYYPHNIHFLVWSAMYQGRSTVSLEMARKVASKIPDHIDEKNWDAYELFRSQPLTAMVRFGLWDEVLAEPKPVEKARYVTAIWHYARALAYLHDGDGRHAKREWKALERIRKSMIDREGRARTMYASLVTIASEIVRGEMAAAAGKYLDAVGHLDRALRVEGTLGYSEPPAWYFPVRHVLGAVLIEAGYPDEAEVVYWTDLREHPDNGYALFGLVQSLRAQDRDDEAEVIAERFDEAWALADVELTTSRF
jgi:tetratricopeptide (TPR) repeat protein